MVIVMVIVMMMNVTVKYSYGGIVDISGFSNFCFKPMKEKVGYSYLIQPNQIKPKPVQLTVREFEFRIFSFRFEPCVRKQN